MGHTVLQLLQPSVTPTGAVGYAGFRTGRYTSIDPVGGFDAEYAWAAYFVTSVHAGAVPLWNPYQGLGQPQLANYVSAVLYPINWLTLALPPAWWDLVYFLDWFLAAYFTYLLGRVLRLNRVGALAGATAVFTVGFFAGFVAVRSIMGTVPWFPFLLYAIERALRQPNWTWKAPALAAGTYCLATGGHPEPAFVGLVLVIAYLAMRTLAAWRSRRRIAVREIVPAILFGGLLAAPQWLPFAQYVFQDATSVHAAAGTLGTSFFPRASLALTVFPYVYGPLNDDIWLGSVSTVAWVPASVTFLALVGLLAVVRRRQGGLITLALLTALGGAKLYGVPLVNDIGRLPLFQQFWFQYTNGFVAVGLCVFAGAGVVYLRREPPRLWRLPYGAWTVYVLAMLGVVAFTMQGQTTFLRAEPWRGEFLLLTLTLGLFWAIAFPAALLLVRLKNPRPHALLPVVTAGLMLQAAACFPNGSIHGFVVFNAVAATVFCLIVVASLTWGRLADAGTSFAVPAAVVGCVIAACASISPRLPSRANPLRPAPYVAWLAAARDAPRIYALDSFLFPDFGAPLGLSSMTNLENLLPKGAAAFFTRFLDDGAHPARFFGSRDGRYPSAPEPLTAFWMHKPYWDLVGVRYVMTNGAYEVNGRVVFDPGFADGLPARAQLVSPVESPVDCASGPFDAVAIVLGTYAPKQSGEVALDVVDPAGTVIARSTVDAATVVDSVARTFWLPGSVCPDPKGQVVLRLRFTPGAPGAMVAFWRYPGATRWGFFFHTLERQPLALGLLRPVFHDPVAGVQVWENPTAADRAFLAPVSESVSDESAAFAALDRVRVKDLRRRAFIEGAACTTDPAFPADASPGRLVSLRVSPNRVAIRYDAKTAGVLTLTDAYSRGWRATVDGRTVPVLKVDGAFRGVCLDGPGEHRVEFVYRPPHWNVALALAATGLIGLAGLTRAGYRQSRS